MYHTIQTTFTVEARLYYLGARGMETDSTFRSVATLVVDPYPHARIGPIVGRHRPRGRESFPKIRKQYKSNYQNIKRRKRTGTCEGASSNRKLKRKNEQRMSETEWNGDKSSRKARHFICKPFDSQSLKRPLLRLLLSGSASTSFHDGRRSCGPIASMNRNRFRCLWASLHFDSAPPINLFDHLHGIYSVAFAHATMCAFLSVLMEIADAPATRQNNLDYFSLHLWFVEPGVNLRNDQNGWAEPKAMGAFFSCFFIWMIARVHVWLNAIKCVVWKLIELEQWKNKTLSISSNAFELLSCDSSTMISFYSGFQTNIFSKTGRF